jgi:anti-sigma factor RsiW
MIKHSEYRKPEDVGDLGWRHGKLSPADEQAWLMSLALDGELSPEEEARLNELLTADVDVCEQWQVWQAMDGLLACAGHVAPSADFVARLDEQLVLQERRRHLRTGAVFALAALELWGSMVAGLVTVAAFVWDNQVTWAGSMVRNLTYWLATLGRLAETLMTGGQSLLAVPQTQWMLGGYVVGALAILLTWVVFLRRSLHVVPQENR